MTLLLTTAYLFILWPRAQVGNHHLLADLLQRACAAEQAVVHAAADGGEEADGIHHQVVLQAGFEVRQAGMSDS